MPLFYEKVPGPWPIGTQNYFIRYNHVRHEYIFKIILHFFYDYKVNNDINFFKYLKISMNTFLKYLDLNLNAFFIKYLNTYFKYF
jgi:hypothetical protein